MVIYGHDSSENDANDEVKTEKIDSQEGNSLRVHDSTKVQDGLNYFLLDNAYSKDVNDSNLKTFKCNY